MRLPRQIVVPRPTELPRGFGLRELLRRVGNGRLSLASGTDSARFASIASTRESDGEPPHSKTLSRRVAPSGNSQTVHCAGGFTLLEVVLAILIAIAILVVALAFYQQATSLRGQLLEESERLATVRQIMDRLSADLRVAPVHTHTGFTGDSNSLRFVTTSLPLSPGTIESDLKRVTYRATFAGEGTNFSVSGLLRLEETAVDLIASPLAPALATVAGDTNSPAAATTEPLTDAIRFLNFRFWDGTAWVESWTGTAPPPGVEVSFGFEPLPPETTPDQYPGEIFRRVIFLPSGQPKPLVTELVARTRPK